MRIDSGFAGSTALHHFEKISVNSAHVTPSAVQLSPALAPSFDGPEPAVP